MTSRVGQIGWVRIGLVLVVTLVAVAGIGVLSATVVTRLGFEDLTRQAARIVHVRCAATDAFLEADSGTIWTRNHFAVLDTLKGEAGATVVVLEPGGVVGNQGQLVPGAPQFEPGDEAVLFLAPTVTGKLRVLGWGQGNYRISHESATGRAMVKPDLAGVEVAVPANVAVEAYPAVRSNPAAPEGLDELKARIHTQLARQANR